MMEICNVVPFAPADQDHLSILERDGFVVLDKIGRASCRERVSSPV